ncbi:MAG: HEPN domain-containing protein [Candidatus Aminicenantaceae bacterium]
MTTKLRTRKVNKSLYSNYLKRAEECHIAAIECSKNEDWNSATICAIHACISACDAMCIYFLGKRHAGENHNNAVRLFKTIRSQDGNLNKNSNRLNRIISIKNMAEYEERLVFKSEAEKIVKDMKRFFSYVRKELPQT